MPKSVIFTVPSGVTRRLAGLHVAVHDAQRVGGGDAVGRLGEQVGGGLRGHRLPPRSSADSGSPWTSSITR